MDEVRGPSDVAGVNGYRPFAPGIERLESQFKEQIASLESLQSELVALTTDERVAKRVARQAQRRIHEVFALERTDPRTANRHRRAPYREVQKQSPGQKRTGYLHLLGRLEGSELPHDPEGLLRLHGAWHGNEKGSMWRLTARVWGPDEARIQAPSPPRLPKHLEEVFTWARATEAHPVLVSLGVSGEVLALHPFDDGNEAVSALLLTLGLRRAGLSGVEWIQANGVLALQDETSKARLAEALTRGDPATWIDHAIGLLGTAYNEVIEDARYAAALVEQTNERQWRLAIWFLDQSRARPDHPWRYREIQEAFTTVPPRTLKRDLAHLRGLGVVRMEGKLKSARYHFLAASLNGSGGKQEPSAAIPVQRSARHDPE